MYGSHLHFFGLSAQRKPTTPYYSAPFRMLHKRRKLAFYKRFAGEHDIVALLLVFAGTLLALFGVSCGWALLYKHTHWYETKSIAYYAWYVFPVLCILLSLLVKSFTNKVWSQLMNWKKVAYKEEFEQWVTEQSAGRYHRTQALMNKKPSST